MTAPNNANTSAANMAVTYLPRKQILRRPDNPRSNFDHAGLEELATSITNHGIIQPLTVRPKAPPGKGGPSGEEFEIVAGERRHRAAEIAKLDQIPCIIRDLTDQQVHEIQLVENLHRTDLDEIEEATGYQRLMKEHGYTIDKIVETLADKRGKTYIYGRLKLLALPQNLQDALRSRQINASVALLIARIPDPKAQTKAAEHILKGKEYYNFNRLTDQSEKASLPYSEREVSAYIQDNYMIRLKGAPFDTGNAKLLPEAGPCNTCPHRTGNMLDEFPDLKKSPDVCTNPGCFAKKKAAAWAAAQTKAQEKGHTVLSDAEARKVFNIYSTQLNSYIDLDDHCYQHPKQKQWRVALGKHLPESRVFARDREGKIHELLPAKAAAEAAKAAGIEIESHSTRDSARDEREALLSKLKNNAAEVAANQALAHFAAQVESINAKQERDLWQLLCELANRDLLHGHYGSIDPDFLDTLRRRKIFEKEIDNSYNSKDRKAVALIDWLNKATLPQLRSFYVERAFSELSTWDTYAGEFDPIFLNLAKHFSFPLKKTWSDLYEKAKADLKAQDKKKKEKQKSEAKPASEADRGKEPAGKATEKKLKVSKARRAKIQEAARKRWAKAKATK